MRKIIFREKWVATKYGEAFKRMGKIFAFFPLRLVMDLPSIFGMIVGVMVPL